MVAVCDASKNTNTCTVSDPMFPAMYVIQWSGWSIGFINNFGPDFSSSKRFQIGNIVPEEEVAIQPCERTESWCELEVQLQLLLIFTLNVYEWLV
jgi:hypothetical protein